jgi:hypothetical protein
LVVAWTKAYGREPDASDASDHAVKAVEALLLPVVEIMLCPLWAVTARSVGQPQTA